MVFDKARPLRRTESPKGASPNNRSARRTKDNEPTENGHAQPCVPEGGEYRTVQLLHRWAFRWSTGLPDFTVSPIYQFTSLPINQSTGIRWASPSGAFPCGIGRSVGSSGKPSSRYGYSNSPPSGTPQPTDTAAHTKNSNDRFGFILKKTSPFLWWGRSFMYFCNDVLRERLTGNWNAYLSPEAH